MDEVYDHYIDSWIGSGKTLDNADDVQSFGEWLESLNRFNREFIRDLVFQAMFIAKK